MLWTVLTITTPITNRTTHHDRSALPFGEEEGEGEGAGMKELCPDRYRTLLEEMSEEEAVRDVHVRTLYVMACMRPHHVSAVSVMTTTYIH